MNQNNKVCLLPDSIYYIPNFISHFEEDYLLKQVESAPKPKWTHLSNRSLQNWGGLPHEKGMVPEPLPTVQIDKTVLIFEKPYISVSQDEMFCIMLSKPEYDWCVKWLSDIGDNIAALGTFEDKVPNHVLINKYLPGQGIMPHEDGSLYYPTVANLTLGSHGVLDFYDHISHHSPDSLQTNDASLENRYIGSVLLERRSLFLMRDEMYTKYLHGIREVKEDTMDMNILNLDKCSVELGTTLERSTRISFTVRHVPKVLKTKLFLSKR